MLAPLDRVEIDTLLHKLPERADVAKMLDSVPHGLKDVIDLVFGRKPSDTEADATVSTLIAAAQRAEDVARL